MKTPSAPKPPSPTATAAAQTGSNISTAIANQMMQTNQTGPYGSLTNSISGYTKFKDPSTGKTYQIPQMRATMQLSPQQQQILNRQNAAQINTGNAAIKATGQLGSILGAPQSSPTMGKVGAAPNMDYVGSGPNLNTSIASGGKIATGFGDAGAITKTYGASDYSADRAKVEQALMSRMNPQLDQERQRLEAQLSNQGIKRGTEAFDRALALHGQQANDAQMQAILAGGQEQSRLTGLEAGRAQFQNQAQQQLYDQLMGRAGFQNQAQQQQFGQNATQAQFGNDAQQQMYANQLARTGFNNDARQATFDNSLAGAGFNNTAALQQFGANQQMRTGAVNNANALMSGAQVQMPQFGGVQNPSMPNIDMGGLINNQYQGQMANYQNQQQSRNQMMGGLFSAGTALLPLLSDERTKQEIEPVGGEFAGNPVYSYEYKHDPGTRHVGVMAQDVKKTHPEAVVPMGRYLGVDYGKLAAVA